MPKDINEMDRPTVIFAIRSYAHPDHYQRIINMSTEKIKALLAYYAYYKAQKADQFFSDHQLERA